MISRHINRRLVIYQQQMTVYFIPRFTLNRTYSFTFLLFWHLKTASKSMLLHTLKLSKCTYAVPFSDIIYNRTYETTTVEYVQYILSVTSLNVTVNYGTHSLPLVCWLSIGSFCCPSNGTFEYHNHNYPLDFNKLGERKSYKKKNEWRFSKTWLIFWLSVQFACTRSEYSKWYIGFEREKRRIHRKWESKYNWDICKYRNKKLFYLLLEIQEFRKIIDEFIGIAETIVSDVEQEKSRAIAAQNLLKSMSKQREAEQQDIQVSLLLITITRSNCFNFDRHFRMKSTRKQWNWNNWKCNCNTYNESKPINKS